MIEDETLEDSWMTRDRRSANSLAVGATTADRGLAAEGSRRRGDLSE